MLDHQFYDRHLGALAELAAGLGARMGAGQAQQALLGANTTLTLAGFTTLLTVNVWLPGTYLVVGWVTLDNASVAGNVDVLVAGLAGNTTLTPAQICTTVTMPATATTAITATVTGIVQVTSIPMLTAPQGINAGQPGAPGQIILQTDAAAGITGVRARSTSLVGALTGATGLAVMQVA